MGSDVESNLRSAESREHDLIQEMLEAAMRGRGPWRRSRADGENGPVAACIRSVAPTRRRRGVFEQGSRFGRRNVTVNVDRMDQAHGWAWVEPGPGGPDKKN